MKLAGDGGGSSSRMEESREGTSAAMLASCFDHGCEGSEEADAMVGKSHGGQEIADVGVGPTVAWL